VADVPQITYILSAHFASLNCQADARTVDGDPDADFWLLCKKLLLDIVDRLGGYPQSVCGFAMALYE
jgi:hypothetical protein